MSNTDKNPDGDNRGENAGPHADRRRFLAGAAAAGAAGAAAVAGGGLAPTPAMAAAPGGSGLLAPTGFTWAGAIPGNPYVKYYPELANRPYIPGYGFAELPMPTEPGAFLSEALKRIFGVFQRCLCITPEAVINFATLGAANLQSDKQRETIRMEGGVGVGIGGGQDNLIQQVFNVILHPGEHISMGIAELVGKITVDHDGNRKVEPSFILPIDTEQIIGQFIRIVNPLNWPTIIGNFVKNPLSIFEELLAFFFPVRQRMNFNVKVKCEKFPDVELVNKATIQVDSGHLSSFPPKNAPYRTPGPVEFVDAKYPNSQPLVVIEKWQPTVDHRKNLPPQVLDPSKALYPESVDVDLPCSED